MDPHTAPPPLRRPGPVRRVVLTGAESTGKTTLAARLARHYEAPWLPEYLRAFVEAKGAMPERDDVERIARGHLEGEAALLPRARRLLLYDTDLITTCVYSRYYFGTCPAWVQRASYERHADLYLLTADDLPWQPDPGQRDGPGVRAALQQTLQQELDRRGVRYVPIAGTLEARLHAATAAIDQLLEETTQKNDLHGD